MTTYKTMIDITEEMKTSSNKYLLSANRIYQALESPHLRIIVSSSEYTPSEEEDVYKSFRIQVHLSDEEDSEVAYFNVFGNYIRAPFERLARITNPRYVPPLMNIDCSDFRGRRVSKMLMLVLFYYAKKKYPRFNEYSELFIDVDASDRVGGPDVSYWTAIGMVDNEETPINIVSTGCEKRCRVRDLYPYLFRV